MLPPHHLPQLTLNRCQTFLSMLKSALWQNEIPLTVSATRPRARFSSLSEAKGMDLERVEPQTSWGRLFDQRWCHLVLSQAADGNQWLRWRDQGEATLYVADQPYYGFNVAHRTCRLPEGAQEVWLQCCCIQSAIWHPEAQQMQTGSHFEGASLVRRDEAHWALFHDVQCLFELALDLRKRENPHLPVNLREFGLRDSLMCASPELRIVLGVLEKTMDDYERAGFASAKARIEQGYDLMRVDRALAKCILTGHAHLDLVWLWPERIAEIKAVNVFATANRLLEEYPEFAFAYSQPASYEAVERREPRLMQSVREKLAAGRWEATGAMYVESDTLLACGEALARSFTLGQAWFDRTNGRPARLTWLPDVFGYSNCMPQIMQQCGVQFFFTTKMTWNAINPFPYSSFIWRGADGSEVLAHVTQEVGYVNHVTVSEARVAQERNQQLDRHREYLMPAGFGDGGGGVTPEMLEGARRISRLRGLPEMEWDQPEAFFRRLETSAGTLPVHQGECYLEYHRGTYTTHSRLKGSFRALERSLQYLEAASAVSGRTIESEEIWKRLVFSQFHDYIPGSAVWDVYAEGIPELEALAQTACGRAREALEMPGESKECRFNPHAVPVTEWLPPAEGAPLRKLVLPPLAGVGLEAAEEPLETEPVLLSGAEVSNGLVGMRLDSNGWIDRLCWEGLEVPITKPLGSLMIYPDQPACFEAWDIDRHTLSLGELCGSECTIEPLDENPIRKGFKVTRTIGTRSRAAVSFLLETESPLVHIEIDLDWNEPESLLKVFFPTGYQAVNARFGAPFGSVLRPQQPIGMAAAAMWEVPFSRYLAVFDEGESEGLFVVTENKYGASVFEGSVGLSLVRSAKVTGMDAQHSGPWPRHLSRLAGMAEHSDLERHRFRVAIGRYAADLPRDRQPASLAETLFTVPFAYNGRQIQRRLNLGSAGETLVPAWIKPEADGFTVRLHEVCGRRGNVTCEIPPKAQWALSKLRGEPAEWQAGPASFAFQPYEILGLRVRFSN